MSYIEQTLNEFLDSVASDKPVPGGGSISAYIAAMGLALLKKTLVFTLKKHPPEDQQKQIQDVLKEANELEKSFLEMVDRDAEVFLNCISGKGKPFKDRFKPSRDIAQQICDLCHQAFKVHAKGSYLYNKSMKSDYEAAQRLIDAAFRISWENAHYGESG